MRTTTTNTLREILQQKGFEPTNIIYSQTTPNEKGQTTTILYAYYNNDIFSINIEHTTKAINLSFYYQCKHLVEFSDDNLTINAIDNSNDDKQYRLFLQRFSKALDLIIDELQ